MKKQITAVPGRSLRFLVVVLLFTALVGAAPYLAQSQEQDDSAEVPQPDAASRPLIGVTTSSQNPLQIAILHWYNANLTTQFTTATAPFGVAFDGSSIWVCNNGSNNVTKLRASDGTVLGTFAVGTNPTGVAYDGANLWVANINGNNVTKLKGTTGATLGTFTVGTQPNALAFDGT
ncbi:MAG TPA: hypothetical protein VI455_00985, partial [Terriglobia bacterium]